MAAFTRYCNYSGVHKVPPSGAIPLCSAPGDFIPKGPLIKAGPSLATLVVPTEGMQLLPISCGVCKQLLDRPTIGGKCGHTFCAGCLVACKRQSATGECPECGERLYTSQGTPNVLATTIINSLKRRCVNAVVYDCAVDAYVLAEPNTGCPFVGTADEMAAHAPVCELNLDFCPEICGRIVAKRDLPTHRVSPTACTVICRRCRATIPSPLKAKHQKDDCPELEVPCPRHDIGCPVVVRRKDLPAHTAVCSHECYRSDLAAMQCKVKECREQIVRQTVHIEALEFELAHKSRAHVDGSPPLKKRKTSKEEGQVKSEPVDTDESNQQRSTIQIGSARDTLVSMLQSFEVALATRSDEVELALQQAQSRLGNVERLTKVLATRQKAQVMYQAPPSPHAHGVGYPEASDHTPVAANVDSVFNRQNFQPAPESPESSPTSYGAVSPKRSSRTGTPGRGGRSRTPERSALAKTSRKAVFEGALELPAHPTLRTLSFWFVAVDNAALSLKRMHKIPVHRSRVANITRALDRMQHAFDFRVMFNATTHSAAKEPLKALASYVKQLATGTADSSFESVSAWKAVVKAVPPGILVLSNDSLLALEKAMCKEGLKYPRRLNEELLQAIVNTPHLSSVQS